MTISLMTRVWEIEDEGLREARLLLLLALADFANEDGQCWPSIPRLAKRGRISERQAQRVMQWLVEEKYVQIVQKGKGRGNVTVYLITLKDDMVTPYVPEKDDMVSPFNAPERMTLATEKDDIGSTKDDMVTPIDQLKGDIGGENQSYARREPPLGGWVGSSSKRKKRKPTHPPKPSQSKTLEPMQQIAFELLVDGEIGMLHRVATELARSLPTPVIYRTVDKWLPDYQAHKVDTGALVSRLKNLVENPRSINAPAVSLSAGFRDSELFHRHRLPDEMIADPERKQYNYVPEQEPRKKYTP